MLWALLPPGGVAPAYISPSTCLFVCFVFLAPISPCFSTNIPLMRLYQTVYHTKRRAGGVLREGWLLHHTNTDTLVRHTHTHSGQTCDKHLSHPFRVQCLSPQRKRHYWILDWRSITLYQNESSTKYYKVEFTADAMPPPVPPPPLLS